MNEENGEVDTHVYLPIIDLMSCRSAYCSPIELTKELQAELEAKIDPRIWEQLSKYYIIVGTNLKRVKPLYLKRLPTTYLEPV